MGIWISVILFVIGILLVMKGGDIFVDAASWIARAAGVPTFIIGATIVSLATTMPEMIVSIIAAAEGSNDMAIGNAVGSVTANTGLIMATAMVFMTVLLPRKKYLPQCLLLIAAAAVLWIGSNGSSLELGFSVLLFIIFVTFMALNLSNARAEMGDTEKEHHSGKAVALRVLLFVLGAAAIVVGSDLLVDHGQVLAVALGVPERVIAVTLVAIGTSLPELVTTLTAIRKKESGLSVGNIIGANIIDLTLILPICSFVADGELTISQQSAGIDMPACLLITLLAIVPMLLRQKASRLQGVLLLLAYGAYLVITI
ncbi:MAG: calcium/sodium antiporter [Oscillospiraceae bacterium]